MLEKIGGNRFTMFEIHLGESGICVNFIHKLNREISSTYC